ncbi:hypothetical protein [Telluria aromaticivorans]|uniref:DUF3995 domain-containing protein n=1 Tax=Telluria aromaticivorans TaxID=2725995 RepID=A0A7Y2NYY4_9BURK|nr:hypothetical protein [Telluria aromaticivorans]NNG22558.1 hypothetical protein [Telluria aromaticivorans]
MKHLKPASRLWIGVAAVIAALGVAIHLACIAGGPSWYAFFGAPPRIVASARDGTWLAPAGTAGIAVLMGMCAAYACSALGLIQRLPLLRPALAGIAAVCLARALVLVPFAWIHPELRTQFELIAALTWGVAGTGFSVAFATARLR